MIKKVLTPLLLVAAVSVCAETIPVTEITPDTQTPEQAEIERVLSGIDQIADGAEVDPKATQRFSLMEKAGLDYGMEYGLWYRIEKTNKKLQDRSSALDKMFDFRRFLVDGNILLPKARVSKRVFEQVADDAIRRVTAAYKLVDSAKLVYDTPTWQEYLFRTHLKPEAPHRMELPANSVEKNIFDQNFKKGWQLGIEQGLAIFDLDWNRLVADYDGHADFRILAVQNIVTYPKLIRGEYTVTRLDDGKTLYINDVMAEIQTDAEFNDISEWTPFFKQGGN